MAVQQLEPGLQLAPAPDLLRCGALVADDRKLVDERLVRLDQTQDLRVLGAKGVDGVTRLSLGRRALLQCVPEHGDVQVAHPLDLVLRHPLGHQLRLESRDLTRPHVVQHGAKPALERLGWGPIVQLANQLLERYQAVAPVVDELAHVFLPMRWCLTTASISGSERGLALTEVNDYRVARRGTGCRWWGMRERDVEMGSWGASFSVRGPLR